MIFVSFISRSLVPLFLIWVQSSQCHLLFFTYSHSAQFQKKCFKMMKLVKICCTIATPLKLIFWNSDNFCGQVICIKSSSAFGSIHASSSQLSPSLNFNFKREILCLPIKHLNCPIIPVKWELFFYGFFHSR